VRAHFTYRPPHGNSQDIREKVFVAAMAVGPGGLIALTCPRSAPSSSEEKPRPGAQLKATPAGNTPAFDPRRGPDEKGGRS
jgi:hypothetical protein